jgi:hypothetical protein
MDPVKDSKGTNNKNSGNTPQQSFLLCEIMLHKNPPQQKEHPHTHLQRPNDVQTNAFASLPGGSNHIPVRLYRQKKKKSRAQDRLFDTAPVKLRF